MHKNLLLGLTISLVAVACKTGASQVAASAPSAAADDIASKFADVNGISIHYLEKGTGPTVLLIHGFPEYSGIWKQYIRALSTHYHVVAPDMRGYNLSSKPSDVDSYAMPVLVEDMNSLIKAVSTDGACVIAHDWGGIVGWYLTDFHPETVKKFMVLNADQPVIFAHLMQTDPDTQKGNAYIQMFGQPGFDQQLAANDYAVLKGLVFTDPPAHHVYTQDEQNGYLKAWKQGLSGQLLYYTHYFAHQDQMTAMMHGVQVPTQVVWGDADTSYTKKTLDGLGDHVKNFDPKNDIVHYPTATHWVQDDVPEQLIPRIDSFCK